MSSDLNTTTDETKSQSCLLVFQTIYMHAFFELFKNNSRRSYVFLLQCRYLHTRMNRQKKTFSCSNEANSVAEKKYLVIRGMEPHAGVPSTLFRTLSKL